MSGHTEGPWRVVNDVDVQSGPTGALAYVSTAGARGRTLEEAKANAGLIAAAPDLLAALEEVYAWVPKIPDGMRRRIEAALTKATGEVLR